MLTLDKQISGLEQIATNNAEEWRAKTDILATLKKLVAIRDTALTSGKPNADRMANMIVDVLGLTEPSPAEQAALTNER